MTGKSVALSLLLSALLGLCGAAKAQTAVPKITSITVDSSIPVAGPDHVTSINIYPNFGLSTLSDEHSTIFPPATLANQTEFLFLVATRTTLNPNESGLVVLAGDEPRRDKPWSLNYAAKFGRYRPEGLSGAQNGQVFQGALAHLKCPSSSPAPSFDSTFDLNYAAPATVFLDPTNPGNSGSGNLLMVYEGSNRCIGLTSASNVGNNFYSTIGIATSMDQGHTWPVYKANFTALPQINQNMGPVAALGAYGKDVCIGNYCSDIIILQPPDQYGRYAVSGPVTTVAEANAGSPGGLTRNTGDSEPAAFIDDVLGRGPQPYVYAVHTYNPGPFLADSPVYPQFPQIQFDISVSRAKLNGGRTRLQFEHWYNGQFNEPGLPGSLGGGHESLLFPVLVADLPHYKQCLAPTQRRSSASISYSKQTHEYVLVFVCTSPTDPLIETNCQSKNLNICQNGKPTGGAWFYSTIDADQYDLSHQEQWVAPREMLQSWSLFAAAGCGANSPGENFNGWYPSLMSPKTEPGHLGGGGWVFYMSGCQGGQTPGSRVYSSRYFTIAAQ